MCELYIYVWWKVNNCLFNRPIRKMKLRVTMRRAKRGNSSVHSLDASYGPY